MVNKKLAFIFVISVLALLLFSGGCSEFKQKLREKKALKEAKQAKAKVATTSGATASDLFNASAEKDIKKLLNRTKEEENDATKEENETTDTDSLSPLPSASPKESACMLAIKEIEIEIDAARNASKELDIALSNKTNAYVKAQEEQENAEATGNQARISSANAVLQRTQGEWEVAKDASKDGRDEVKRLKLVLVKAKDDCDPTYVPPYAANPPTAIVSSSSNQTATGEDVCAAYNETQVSKELAAAKKKLQELQDELNALEDEKEAAEKAGNNYKVQDVEKEIRATEKSISSKQSTIRQLEARLDALGKCPPDS